MKRIIVSCLAVVLGAVVIDAQGQQVNVSTQNGQVGVLRGSLMVQRTPFEARAIKGAPYWAEVVTEAIQTLADGNRIVHRTTGRVYRDSEGRVRREEDQASGVPTISVSDPAAGTGFVLDTANRTARDVGRLVPLTVALNDIVARRGLVEIQQPAPAAVAGARVASVGRGGRGEAGGTAGTGRRARVGSDAVEEALPARTIEGVPASGVRRTTTIDKGAIGNELPIKIVSEEWTSPDLQVLVMTDFSDPRTGRSTYRLLKILRGEPDAALFQLPAGYTMQPAPASGARGRARGGTR